ncbi:hypothetical protein SAMN05444354_12058 [Stigmatella aurantiaca]|uniref:Uncharacterized protein n=1 Tax=Stigmatella aurantiaca TaxID=41 RepID=A0A1H8A1M8_STIAU|nr:hypothetical protein [Stigmatella aurantiaca]SEM64406.1 hypothetical protein SAMN05444354_12058 [Stigmatella aurantiaca]
MLRQLLLSELDVEALKAERGWAELAARFPAVAVQALASGEGAQVLRLEVEEWRAPGFDPFTWDPRVFTAAGMERLALHLVGTEEAGLARSALEILTRYQGLVGQRNADSAGSLFDHLLERHRAQYALDQPQACARYQHALDTWQWVLWLEPQADLATQLAALFHDLDVPEPGAGEQTHALLTEAGLDAATCEAVRELLRAPESSPRGRRQALLEEADGLSFLSLSTEGFRQHFGPAHRCWRGAPKWLPGTRPLLPFAS